MNSRSKCTKLAHETKRLALVHARSVRIRQGDRLHAYVCHRCGKWHVGHNHKAPVYKILKDLDRAD